MKGTSGYITFSHEKAGKVTIAFSNPLVGKNRIGVGTDESCHKQMRSHFEELETVKLQNSIVSKLTNSPEKINNVLIVFEDSSQGDLEEELGINIMEMVEFGHSDGVIKDILYDIIDDAVMKSEQNEDILMKNEEE